MIVDKISCINPYSKVREIDLLENRKLRIQKWDNFKKKMNIKEYEHKVWKNIKE